MSEPILEADELVRLRHAAGLSQRALGRTIGVSGNLINRLEGGAADTNLTLHQLHRIAETLGTTPRALLHRRPTDTPIAYPDAARAAAALADSPSMVSTEELALTLSWDLVRARRALLHLRRALQGTGLALRRSPNGFKLTADADSLSPEERRRLQRARIKRHGLRLNEAALLRVIATTHIGPRWEARARNSDRVAIAALLKAGYVTRTRHGYAISDDVAFSFAGDAQAEHSHQLRAAA